MNESFNYLAKTIGKLSYLVIINCQIWEGKFMWHELIKFFLNNTIIFLFLSLAIGYVIGQIKIKSFSFGATVGVLVSGLVLGQLANFTIDPLLKNVFFSLFIFTIGYEVGPTFIQSLKRSGLKLVAQAFFFAIVAFLFSYGLLKLFRFNPGEAGGIVSGAITQSAALGTATSAINNLKVSEALKSAYTSDAAIAYAVTYIFGTIATIVTVRNIGPLILGVNLKEETKKVVEQLHFTENGNNELYDLESNIVIRSFKIIDLPSTEVTVDQFEKGLQQKVIVQQVFTNDRPQPFTHTTNLRKGQVVTIIGNNEEIYKLETNEKYYQEIFDDKYKKIPIKKVEVMLTRVFNYYSLKSLVDKSIIIISAKRDGKDIDDLTKLRSDDRVTIAGPDQSIQRAIPSLGYPITQGEATDVSFLSIGIVLGVLLGDIIITIKGLPITLGSGGGVLFSGLFLGWYQNKNIRIGNIPSSTRWFLKSVGLNGFIATVGLGAGSQFVKAIQSMGIKIILIGLLISTVPFIITLLFGKYILKFNAVDNIGSLAGGGTSNSALNSIIDQTGSSIFALSFTPTYAIGNILITMFGSLMVTLIGG